MSNLQSFFGNTTKSNNFNDLKNLLDQKTSVLCVQTEKNYYTLTQWIQNYLDKKFQNKTVQNSVELKNYSTFDITVKIFISNNYIIFDPYSTAVDRYIFLEILFPFVKNNTNFQQNTEKIVIIRNLNLLHIKNHKYLLYFLKNYSNSCTFLLLCENTHSISPEIFKNIFIYRFPFHWNENSDSFWDPLISKVSWEKTLDNIFTLFFTKKKKKKEDIKILRSEISNLYTSNINSSNVIQYIVRHLPYYNINCTVEVFNKICEIEYYLKIGNRYIIHFEYLILYLQSNIHG
jgi:hypothetical protein